jgi:hypothetical protein
MFGGSKKSTSKATPKPAGSMQALAKLTSLPATIDLFVAVFLAGYSAFAIFVDGAKFVGLVALLVALFFAGLGLNAVLKEMKSTKSLERIRSLDQLLDLDLYEAEALVTAIYSLRGYTVISADEDDRKQEDVDLIASKGKKDKVLIRCRDGEGKTVPLETVKKLKAAVTGLAATSAVIYTTGKFANDAVEFGTTKGIELLSGPAILCKIGELTGASFDAGALPVGGHAPTPDSVVSPYGTSYKEDLGKPSKIIFVDPAAVQGGADIFAQVLAKHTDYQLVVSTNRDSGEDALRTALPDFAARVIGQTPTLNMPGMTRYLEIRRYLEDSAAPGAIWAALDTCPQLFPEATIELIALSKERGFTHGAAARLSDALRVAEHRLSLRGAVPIPA